MCLPWQEDFPHGELGWFPDLLAASHVGEARYHDTVNIGFNILSSVSAIHLLFSLCTPNSGEPPVTTILVYDFKSLLQVMLEKFHYRSAMRLFCRMKFPPSHCLKSTQ